MSADKKLAILGCGGHARSVADVALTVGFDTILFIDENARIGEMMLGFQVLHEVPPGIEKGCVFIPASGDNLKRELQIKSIEYNGWQLGSVVSPCATIGAGAKVASGTFIGHHAHVGPRAEVGVGCIINTAAIVEHDSKIGNYTHISVNATVAGTTKIGCYCFLGTGSTAIDGLNICDNVIIGAGSVVVRPIISPGTHVGIPAKLLKSR